MGTKDKEYPSEFLKALKELEEEGVIEIDEEGVVTTLKALNRMVENKKPE